MVAPGVGVVGLDNVPQLSGQRVLDERRKGAQLVQRGAGVYNYWARVARWGCPALRHRHQQRR